jgi:hypothetical protein
MEISAVRQQMLLAIERAKRAALDRRAANDAAARQYGVFLDQVAVPLFRQAANVLRAEGYFFSLFTPGGSVRLMSDKSADDFIELVLNASGRVPSLMGRTSRAWGNRTDISEQPLKPSVPIGEITEEDVLAFLLKALEPFVEKSAGR